MQTTEMQILLPDREVLLARLRAKFGHSESIRDYERKQFPELLKAAGMTVAPEGVITLVLGTIMKYGPHFWSDIYAGLFMEAIVTDALQLAEVKRIFEDFLKKDRAEA